MNLLEQLPQYLTINDEKLEINTGFKTWCKLQKAFSSSISDIEAIALMLTVFKKDIKITHSNIVSIRDEIFEFIEKAQTFYNGDFEVVSNADNKPKASSKQDVLLFDIELDSNYIYSAFKEQYNIDLADDDIHYYKFIALFDCIKDNTLFKSIVKIRNTDTRATAIKDDKERRKLQAIKKSFELPKNKEG